jgi:cobalamin biosynthesis Co2+ chelatase CbiK
MSQFERTRIEISKDIQQVFEGVKSEVHSNYFLSKNSDLARTQSLVRKYVPGVVADKNSLLVDTVLNYLTEDARKVLTGAENHVFNDFYEENRRWKKMLTSDFQDSIHEDRIMLSPDPRVTYSAGTGFAVFVLSGLLSKAVLSFELLTLPLALLLGAGASALTYKQTTPLAMDKTEEDVAQYLKQEESRTIQAIQKVIKMYEGELTTFLRPRN